MAPLLLLAALAATAAPRGVRPEPQTPTLPPAPADSASGGHPLESADLGAWLDGLLPFALQAGDIAGVVIAVVKDGQVVLERGYGYADVAAHTPMDAERTVIRAGSTSKLFTWTAVMQLVAAGKIDLHRDVNDYLDFRLPDRFGRPVTMLDLMNHRAGFEEGLKDVLIVDATRLPSNESSLKQHPRPQIFAPGTVPAYSNYGAGLAGYIVERVSGERFEEYVARHIFGPLGMQHSSFEQPFPAAIESALARGYRTPTDPPQPIEYIATRPAGSLATTVSDLTRFLRAHLADGEFAGARILDRDTARLMHEPSVPAPPGFSTMAHGFFHETRNGRTLIGHGGDTIAFHTEFDLLPAEGIGITYTFNGRGRDDAVYGLRKAVLDGFMDRYFPSPAGRDAPRALDSAVADATRIAGPYESSRRIEHGLLAIFYLLQQTTLTANADGTLGAPRELEPGPATFREIAPDLWQQVDGTRRLALRTVEGVRTIIDSEDPSSVLQAVPWHRRAGLNLAVLGGTLLVLVSVAGLWPVSALLRRRYRVAPEEPRARSLERRVRLIVLGNLAYALAWTLMLLPVAHLALEFYSSSLDPVVRALQVAGVLVVVANVVGVVSLWRLATLRRGAFAWIRAAMVAAALGGIVWIGLIGQLISFNLNY
ncbi:MAG: beta-lactamase family protein [Proteobacteria bacterium]|nr:beta-lactamase family protein [Pseudomonadota bacterium]